MSPAGPRAWGPVRLAGPLVLLLVAAALGACSSADGTDDSARSSTTTVTAAPTTTPTTTPAPLTRYADYVSVEYDDPAHWLCRPDLDGDACDVDLDATVVAPDGSTEVEEFEADPDAPVDCFYVYPTVSRDPSPTSDWVPGDTEERFVVVNQAARLGSVCRLFAPMYRQITTTALTGGARLGGPGAADPYADVLDAFRTYMAQDNEGRGVVLVGHSQGTLWLNRLLREEIDPDPDVRDLLVGAYLAGGQVMVPPGQEVGGDLSEIPLCTADGQPGCLTTWSSVLPAAAPAPADGGTDVVACVNPAAIGGAGTTHPYFGTGAARALGRAVDGATAAWADPATTPIDTPFVRLSDRFTASCRPEPAGSRLEVVWTDDPAGSAALPGARGADLHLLDVNLVMGDVVEQVRAQTAASPDLVEE